MECCWIVDKSPVAHRQLLLVHYLPLRTNITSLLVSSVLVMSHAEPPIDLYEGAGHLVE